MTTRLSRRAALTLLGAAATVAAPSRPAAQPRLRYDLEPVPVADGVWMVEGSTDYFSMENGGAIVNCALIATEAGLVVVDTGSSLRYGEALSRAARFLTGQGVAEVVVTHHHPDHFFGSQPFADRPIRALGETIRLSRERADAYADALYRLLGDWMRGTEPTPPTSAMEPGPFAIGGRVFEAIALGGHTAADLALLDVKTGVLIAGDLAFLDRAPTTPDADIPRWKESLDVLETIEASAILPGHGPLDPAGAALRQTRAYLEWLDATLKDGAERGLDMVEVMDLQQPPEFAALGAQPAEFHRSVSHLFPRYEEEALPLLD